MKFSLLGEQAVLMQADDASASTAATTSMDMQVQQRIWSMAHALQERRCCLEIVPGMNNLTVIYDAQLFSAATMLALMRTSWEAAKIEEFCAREMCIPVVYGGQSGPDLEVVALHNRLEPEDVIRLHSEAVYTVYFLGFQPGFAYLGGLPAKLATPRRSEPRLQVPAGTVAIGGAQTGIYPQSSPGGWQLIGHSPVNLFDFKALPPNYLRPGDRLRFVVERIDG